MVIKSTSLDDFFEEEAAAQRAKAIKEAADPKLQAFIAAKRAREQAAADAGLTVYTPEEIAAHEAEEAEEEEE